MKKIAIAATLVVLGCVPGMAQESGAPTPTDPHAWYKNEVQKSEATTTTSSAEAEQPAPKTITKEDFEALQKKTTGTSEMVNKGIESIDSNYPKEVQELQARKENTQMMTAITSPIGLASIAGLLALLSFMVWKSWKKRSSISAD